MRLRTAPVKIIIWLILTILLFSCRHLVDENNIDQQPAHTEVKYVADSVITVTIDTTRQVDTFNKREQHVTAPIPVAAPIDSLIDAIYMSQLGVREATGHNDGRDVEKYLRSVGAPKGSAWCAAFVKWCFDQANVRTTITAWSPTAHNKNNIVYGNAKEYKAINKGDVGTLYYAKLKRIGHTFFIKGKFGMNSLQTVEGNTNQAGSREGDGVYMKIRPKSSIYSITRWF